MPLGERLLFARVRAGLTLSQVRARTEIGESSLSEFENGRREPSLSQLQKLAALYERSIEFFLSDDPLPASTAVLWRERPVTNAEQLEVHFLRLCEQFHNLEIWCNDVSESFLPDCAPTVSKFGRYHAKQLAKRVRDDLQLGDRPGQNLLRVLEEVCKIKIFHLSFDPSGAAASTKDERFGCAVLLNAKNARWRRNFDLAHELFHLLTWNYFRHSDGAVSTVASDEEEQLANIFASNVLMPEDVLKLTLGKFESDGKITLSSEAMCSIAREFDVSIDAIMWQLHFIFRSPGDKEKTIKEIKQLKQHDSLFEQREQEPASVWPARYRALAVQALLSGEVSIGRFAEYLNISRHDAARYLEPEMAESEEVQFITA